MHACVKRLLNNNPWAEMACQGTRVELPSARAASVTAGVSYVQVPLEEVVNLALTFNREEGRVRGTFSLRRGCTFEAVCA